MKLEIREEPTWDQGVDISSSPALNTTIEADIAIIGAGLAGVALAYLLRESGKKVVLLEKYKIGWGATGVTTAFLTQSIDTDYADLITMFGLATTKKIAESHGYAISLIERIVSEHNIECEFTRCSNFSYANDEKETGKDLQHLHDEVEAAKRAGLPITLNTDDALGFPNAGYMEVKNQGKFHPRKYLSALVALVREAGVEIFEHTEVQEIIGRRPHTLVTSGGEVHAKHVVVTTYAPFNKKLFFKKAFYDSYVFELEIPKDAFKEGIYEDMMDPYHYFRIDRKDKKDRMVIGGEDHRSDIPVDASKNFQALHDYIKERFPGLVYRIVRKWQGPIVEPVDGLAYIGSDKKDGHMYYATGFSGNGMTYSHIAASIIGDAIVGKQNKFSSIYQADRRITAKQLAYKARDYGSEFVHGALRNSVKYRKKHH